MNHPLHTLQCSRRLLRRRPSASKMFIRTSSTPPFGAGDSVRCEAVRLRGSGESEGSGWWRSSASVERGAPAGFHAALGGSAVNSSGDGCEQSSSLDCPALCRPRQSNVCFCSEKCASCLLNLNAREGLREAHLLRPLTIQSHGLAGAQREKPVALAGPGALKLHEVIILRRPEQKGLPAELLPSHARCSVGFAAGVKFSAITLQPALACSVLRCAASDAGRRRFAG